MIDQTDWQILNLLKTNSKMQFKEIGKHVHLTGQAVAARVRRMEDAGVIQRYTIDSDDRKLGLLVTALIHVYMKTSDHKSFLKWIDSEKYINETYRISGSGCYFMKAVLPSETELNALLEKVLQFGNYSLNLAITRNK